MGTAIMFSGHAASVNSHWFAINIFVHALIYFGGKSDIIHMTHDIPEGKPLLDLTYTQ